MILEKAVLGAGCFWHIEHYFSKLKGVISTRVGYERGMALVKKLKPRWLFVSPPCTGHCGLRMLNYYV